MANKHLIRWYFYKPMFSFNLLFTLICLWGVIKNGYDFIPYILPVKFMGFACVLGHQYLFGNNSHFYFRNAGFSIRHLYICVLGLDLSFCILMSALYLYFQYGFKS